MQIIWSPGAAKSFEQLILFLETKWEKKVIENLFSELNKTLQLISVNPEMFPLVHPDKNIRKCVIKRRTLLLYRIKTREAIQLIVFADTRQNPKKYDLR